MSTSTNPLHSDVEPYSALRQTLTTGKSGQILALGSVFLNGLWAFQLGRIWTTLRRDASLEPLPATTMYPTQAHRDAAPLVSIILPARNEEKDIACCVRSLLDQDYPNLEIIVVDDRSTDATSEIVRQTAAGDSRLTLIQGTPPPEGWAGKTNAVTQAVAVARGQWLLFTDADTSHHPSALTAALTCVQRERAQLLSLAPARRAESFWEKLLIPTSMMGSLATTAPHRINARTRPRASANGQYLLIERAVYEAVGGFAAVRHDPIEDWALARRVIEQGYRNYFAFGMDIVSVRQFVGLGEIWRGWRKTTYFGTKVRRLLGPQMFVGSMAGLMSSLGLPFALRTIARRDQATPVAMLAALLTVITAALTISVRFAVDRRLRYNPIYALGQPIGYLMLLINLGDSLLRSIRKQGISWKGRTYY